MITFEDRQSFSNLLHKFIQMTVNNDHQREKFKNKYSTKTLQEHKHYSALSQKQQKPLLAKTFQSNTTSKTYF